MAIGVYVIPGSQLSLQAGHSHRKNMPESTLRGSIDITEIELEQLGHITTLDPRSVRDFAGSSSPRVPLTHPCRNNNTRDDDQRDHRTPLAVELTGYHLLNLTVILAFGIPKAVLSYRGESVIPTTFDWVSGTFLATL